MEGERERGRERERVAEVVVKAAMFSGLRERR